MSKSHTSASLYDPEEGAKAIRIRELAIGLQPSEPPRTNYFTIYHFAEGRGEFWADTARHEFAPGSLLFFTPYQYLRITPQAAVSGDVLQFHANFLCVETFHAETGCAGMLFNDLYHPPIVCLDSNGQAEVADLFERIHQEQITRGLGYEEMSLAYLKVLLVMATRHKSQAAQTCMLSESHPRHPVLAPLKQLIEDNYRTLHAPSEYAKRLHMTPKSLGRVVREQLGKSLTDLIRERVLTDAKWQLLHTLKPVKEIAHTVGFRDELYFSRVFKKATGFSPTFFREFETQIRNGSNLSMLSSDPSILTSERAADNPDR